MDPTQAWADRRRLVRVATERRWGPTVTRDTRSCIARLPPQAPAGRAAVRGHWGIENARHGVWDVAFLEDDCGLPPYQTPHNRAMLRRLALNVRKQAPTTKLGLANKRLQAAWDPDYRLKGLALRLQGS